MKNLQENFSLQPINTFGLEENARFYSKVQSLDELNEALNFAQDRKIPCLILGGGSNILITKEFPGIVIQLINKGIKKLKETEDKIWLEVSAGENWHQFVIHCLENQWFGLENLSLIPGSVGAAPMQNIGAYGVEVGQFVESVQWIDRESRQINQIQGENCRFGYRESIFKQELKNKAIIWSVIFCLNAKPNVRIDYGDIKQVLTDWKITEPTPKDVSNAVISIRKTKLPDPAEIGNAGSFFKNPIVPKSIYTSISSRFPDVPHYPVNESQVKIPAAWLIETAGWKGRNFGNYGVHERQALVLVNYGGARGKQIWDLAQSIMTDVKEKFGIELQPEVNLI